MFLNYLMAGIVVFFEVGLSLWLIGLMIYETIYYFKSHRKGNLK